jgi:hypothetical protein
MVAFTKMVFIISSLGGWKSAFIRPVQMASMDLPIGSCYKTTFRGEKASENISIKRKGWVCVKLCHWESLTTAKQNASWLTLLAGHVVAWGEDFRGRGCYLQPPGDPQRVNLTGILKQNNKAPAVIRGVASDTDRARLTTVRVLLHGYSMTIIVSFGRYEIC